jgi:sugar-specific transcriptional regulator TrmB
MDLKGKLTNLGLTEKQAGLYLACLQLGIASITKLADASGLKRPTVYLILDDLEKMNLVSSIQKDKKKLYIAEDPKNLLTNLDSKKEIALEVLPMLRSIHNLNPEKPNIRIGEGIQSVHNAYINVFNYLSSHPQEELLIFGSLKDAEEYFKSEVLELFFRALGKTKNLVREIGNDDHETRTYYRYAKKINPRHEIRLINDESRFFQNDNMLFGNKLTIFSVKEQIFTTTIESANIAETYRTLFNMAWKSGKKI